MWKVPGDRAASILQETSRTTWTQKMEKKQIKKEFQEVMQESRAAYGAKQKVCSLKTKCCFIAEGPKFCGGALSIKQLLLFSMPCAQQSPGYTKGL